MKKNLVFFLLVTTVSAQPNQALSTMIKGIQTDNIELVRSVLEPQKKVDINTAFPFTYGTEIRHITPLMLAALVSNQAMVTFLIEKGASLNATDNKGNTVLMYALRPQNETMFSDLISRQAPFEQSRQDGITVLMMAAAWGYDTFIELILKNALQKGLVENYVLQKDKQGKTALDYAKNTSTKAMVQKYMPQNAPSLLPASPVPSLSPVDTLQPQNIASLQQPLTTPVSNTPLVPSITTPVISTPPASTPVIELPSIATLQPLSLTPVSSQPSAEAQPLAVTS